MPNSPGLRDGMEDPEALAGLHVESADVALHVVLARWARRRSRCAAPTITTFFATIGVECSPTSPVIEIDLLIVILLQIDDAVFAETRHRHAGLGVERDQPIAGRDVEDALFFAVGPVGEAMAGKLPRRILAALAFVFAVHPAQFAGGGVEGDHARGAFRR